MDELKLMTQRVKQLEQKLNELEELLLANNGRKDFSQLLHEMLERHLGLKGAPNGAIQ